jgi:GntR family transcriptional regulator
MTAPPGFGREYPEVAFSFMLPFQVTLQPGQPIVDQIVFAAVRAILSGELKVGDSFPSVRVIAAELKVHPNTVMKVTQRLIGDGWLISKPGVGTTVAEPPEARAGDRGRLLDQEVEKLTVEARRVGLSLDDLIRAIRDRWNDMEGGRT